MRRGTSIIFIICVALQLQAIAAESSPIGSSANASGHVLPPWIRRTIDTAAQAGQYRLDDLVSYDAHHGRIIVRLTIPSELAALATQEREHGGVVRFSIVGDPGIWTLQFAEPRPSRPWMTVLTCYDTDPAAPFCCFALTVRDGAVSIKGFDFAAPGGKGRNNYAFTQFDSGARLAWQLPTSVAPQGWSNPAGPTPFGEAFSGHDLITGIADVESRFPLAWVRYGVPIFRRLGAEHLLHRHPAVDVYRMFPQVQPDSRTVGHVDELVSGLGSASFSERQAAQHTLRAMGRPAVLALMRIDPSTLSPEQIERRRKLLSDDDWQPITEEYAVARKDLALLLDCLEDDDPALRAQAKRAVESLIGRKLDFDVNLDRNLRGAAVDALRDQLRAVDAFRDGVKAK